MDQQGHVPEQKPRYCKQRTHQSQGYAKDLQHNLKQVLVFLVRQAQPCLITACGKTYCSIAHNHDTDRPQGINLQTPAQGRHSTQVATTLMKGAEKGVPATSACGQPGHRGWRVVEQHTPCHDLCQNYAYHPDKLHHLDCCLKI